MRVNVIFATNELEIMESESGYAEWHAWVLSGVSRVLEVIPCAITRLGSVLIHSPYTHSIRPYHPLDKVYTVEVAFDVEESAKIKLSEAIQKCVYDEIGIDGSYAFDVSLERKTVEVTFAPVITSVMMLANDRDYTAIPSLVKPEVEPSASQVREVPPTWDEAPHVTPT